MEENGYRFVGWYIDPERRKRLNPGGILPGITTLYQKWIPVRYPITYEMDGGMNARKNPRYTTVAVKDIALHPARKAGYNFVTWLYEGHPVSSLPEHHIGPITLTAQFIQAPMVSFESNGGGQIAPVAVNLSWHLERIPKPGRMGYVFKGWHWDEQCYFPFDNGMVKKDCTLYAKWEVAEYCVIFDAQGGFPDRANPRSFTYFSERLLLAGAHKKGYQFEGWYDVLNHRIETIEPKTMGDLYLQAHWRLAD